MTTEFTSFSVNVFYNHKRVNDGLRRCSRIHKLNERISLDDHVSKKSNHHKWPKAFQSRINGPTVCWKTFYRQSEAFEFAKQFSEDVHVFAFESATDPTLNKGQRKYLATSLPMFWHYYSQLADTRKAHYEIIPEGSLCKLYFDLEFQKAYNPSSNGNCMTDIFIKYVCLWLSTCYGFDIDRSYVLDLDASTSTKFSRHLIFQLPGSVFEHNVIVGKFVHYIMAILVSYVERHSSLFVDKSLESHSLSNSRTANKSLESQSQNNSDISNYNTAYLSYVTKELNEMDKSCLKFCDHPSNNFNDFRSGEDMEVDKICLHSDTSSSEFKTICAKQIVLSYPAHAHCNIMSGSFHKCQDSSDVPALAKGQFSSDSNLPNPCLLKNKNEKLTSSTEENADDLYDEKARKVLSLFFLEDLQAMFVRKQDGSHTLFCDLGVYTRNRNFRLYLSSKLNKNNHLLLAKENVFKPELKHETFECDIFYDSLVTHFRNDKDVNILTFDEQSERGSIKKTGHKLLSTHKKNIVSKTGTLEGWNCASPYPELDHFITSLITNNGHSGSIRHWTYFPMGETLVYDIVGYRWCGNIRRQHKSNNIMYVTDLRQGVYYQKCYDPECHTSQYRSPEMPLPQCVLPGFYFEDDGICEENVAHTTDSDDQLLLTALEDAELLLEEDTAIS